MRRAFVIALAAMLLLTGHFADFSTADSSIAVSPIAKPGNSMISGAQGESWKCTPMSTPNADDNLYDAAWCPGKDFAVIVGRTISSEKGLSYSLKANGNAFADRKTISPGVFYSIDYRAQGDYALVAGRSGTQKFAVWNTTNGTGYNLEWSLSPGGDLRDVGWNSTGTCALAVGYLGSEVSPGTGVIYRFDNGSLGSPADITPAWLTEPMYAVAWAHGGSWACIGGKETLLLSDGQDVWVLENITGFKCNDIAISPDDSYIVIAGELLGNGSGAAIAIDRTKDAEYTAWAPKPLDGVSWKSTGNFASISGHAGEVLEFSDGVFRAFSSGTVKNLRRQCWMDPAFDPFNAGRYEYNLIVGEGNGSGAQVLKYRQNDGNNPAVTEKTDVLADAPDFIADPDTQALSPGDYAGYLDAGDQSDFYKMNVPANRLVRVKVQPCGNGDCGIRLYDDLHVLIADINYGWVGQAETLLYNVGSSGGNHFIELYRNGGAGSYNFNLTYIANSAIRADINRPDVSDVITGGKAHSITLSVSGGVPPYRISADYSTDGGLTFPHSIVKNHGPVAGPRVDLPWDVPRVNCSMVRLMVFAIDGAAHSGWVISQGNFSIDSAPPVVNYMSPLNNTANVPLDQRVYVKFGELMNITIPPETVAYIDPKPPGAAWNWDITGDGLVCTHEPFAPGIKYTVFVNKTAKDASDTGNYMANTYSGCIRSKSLLPPLKVTLVSPNGNENWTAGSMRQIKWNISGGIPPYNVTIDYSRDGGATRNQLKANITAPSPFAWKVPDIATSYNCIVNISARDSTPAPSETAWDTCDGNFTIYNPLSMNSPEIISTDPQENGKNVSISRNVVINFSKQMDTASFAFNCTPDPGGWSLAWYNMNRTVNMTHAGFAYGTEYKFNVTSSNDTYGKPRVPGSVPNPWSFTTVALAQPEIIDTVPADTATAVALNQSLVIEFSEPMNTTSIKFACAPDPGGWTQTWSGGDKVVTIGHKGFSYFTEYKFNVTSAKDKSGMALAPGAVPNPWTFTTTTSRQISRVEIFPYPQLIIAVGDRQQFVAQAFDGDGLPLDTDVNYSWSITGAQAGDLSADFGRQTTFAASSAGNCTLRVTASHPSGSRSNSTKVLVSAVAPVLDRAAVEPDSVIINSGESADFTAIAYDGTYVIGGASFTWALSSASIGTLSNDKNQTVTFSALERGNGTISVNVSYRGKSKIAAADISVIQTVDSISISPASVSLRQKEKQAFTATAYDKNGNAVPGVVFSWAMAGGIGTLDNGTGTGGAVILTAGSRPSNSWVNATAEGKGASASVTVLADLPPLITHNPVHVWNASTALPIYADVTDDYRITDVMLHYRPASNGTWKSIRMANATGSSNYSAIIPASDIIGDIEYYISATDDMNQTSTDGNATAPHRVTVKKPQPPVNPPQEKGQDYTWAIVVLALVAILIVLFIIAKRRGKKKDDEKRKSKAGITQVKMKRKDTKAGDGTKEPAKTKDKKREKPMKELTRD